MELVAYAQVVLTAVERRALHLRDVDWSALRASALAAVAGARSQEQVHDLLRDVVHQVGGPHSRLIAPDAVPPFDAATQELPAARVVGDIGVLHLPSCRGTTGAVRAYARAGARALRAVPAVRGWVVDLRDNRGGSMWPMLAVAAPLLGGDGTLGTFTTREGKRIPWWLHHGWVGAGWHPLARSRGPRDLPGPVAVLTGADTASSGEAVAIAFRGLRHVRSYGSPTHGFSTANEVVRLPDGALLLITTATMADRDGVVSDGPLSPDVRVQAPHDALTAALADLAGQTSHEWATSRS